jgi:hypothetical protein
MIDWLVQGKSFSNCNCDHWCPCQFEGLPTHNACKGVEIFRVDKGHFGDVDLAGVTVALIFEWPGPIFEGGGTMQAVIEPSATDEQAAAISKIVKGEETKEGANHWWVFHSMSDTILEDLRLPIEFAMDQDERTAHVSIPGYLEGKGEPLRNPFNGASHRVQIRCPDGIEFDIADIGNASTDITGDIPMKLENSYGQFIYLDHTNNGPAHNS